MTRLPKRTKAQEERRQKGIEEGFARAAAFKQMTQGKGKPMTYGTGKPPSEKDGRGRR
jgi:hypothetical protein